MKRNILDFSILKEEISQNNVLVIAEHIAFMELRYQIGYQGSRVQKIYADLYADIKHKNELVHTFSDSYDLVQEGALSLCEHYGKHLSDIISYSKKGKPITIEIACIRKMMRLINLKARDYHRLVSLDALTPVSEPSYEIKEEVAQNYTLYEKIVSSLNLTENMRIALGCRQNGLSYPEIGRVLSRTQSTVFEYFIKMRQRYTAIYE